MKRSYKEMQKERQEKWNALPIYWAFDQEGFEKVMKKMGLTTSEEDCKKITGIEGGGFMLKSDLHLLTEFSENNPILEAMKDFNFAVDAFYSEMCNHEYCYNHYQGDWEVCGCFCKRCRWLGEDASYKDYLKAGGYGAEIIKAYETALNKYNADCLKNDWI